MRFLERRARGMVSCAALALALTLLAGCSYEDNPYANLEAAGPSTPPPAAGPAAGTGDTGGSTKGTRSVTIDWNAPTEYEDGSPFIDLAGYRIWYGKSPGSYSNLLEIAPGMTSHKVDSLEASTYYFSITAYNYEGAESTLSNEIKVTLN